mgnify:CR=1 FL=1
MVHYFTYGGRGSLGVALKRQTMKIEGTSILHVQCETHLGIMS